MEQKGHTQRIEESLANYLLALIEKDIDAQCQRSGVNKSALASALAERLKQLSTIHWIASKPSAARELEPLASANPPISGEAAYVLQASMLGVDAAYPDRHVEGTPIAREPASGPNTHAKPAPSKRVLAGACGDMALAALGRHQPISIHKLIRHLWSEHPEVNHRAWAGAISAKCRKGIIRRGRDKLLRLRP